MDRLSTLKLLVSAVDAGSISRAARRHGLSTTSASRRLMELEQELGVRLLDRTTRYVAPTEAGRRLRDRGGADDRRARPRFARGRRGSAGAFGHAPHLCPSFLRDAAYSPAPAGVPCCASPTGSRSASDRDCRDRAGRGGGSRDPSSARRRRRRSSRMCLQAAGESSPPARTTSSAPAPPQEIEDLRAHDCLTYRRAEADPSWVFETPSGRRELVVRGPLRATSWRGAARGRGGRPWAGPAAGPG